MTSTVKLRALEPEDLDLVYHIENDSALWQWGADCMPYSRYALRQYIAQQGIDIYQDGQLRQVIEADGTAVGIADLTSFSPHHRRAEVGIVVISGHQRQGFASEALRQLAQYGKEHLHLNSLYAYVGKGNEPAQALFQGVGYAAVGQLDRWIEGRETATLYQLML